MTLEEVRDEIYYYTGRIPSEQECKQILYYVNNGSNLSEIIRDYYGG